MEVKLGCMLRPYGNCPVERALAGIARAGFRYTAFLGQLKDGGAYDLSTPISEPLAWRKQAERFGVKPVTAWAGNPLTYGAAGMLRHVEIAAELGLEYLILSSPFVDASNGQKATAEEVKAEFVSIVESALPACEKAGLRLDVKPHTGPYGVGPGLLELAEAIDHPCFGIAYDPGNVHYYEGLPPETDLATVTHRVTSLCVKDHKGPQWSGSFPNPGDGEVNWPIIFELLHKGGFGGYAMIEVMGAESTEALDATGEHLRKQLTAWIQAAGGNVVD